MAASANAPFAAASCGEDKSQASQASEVTAKQYRALFGQREH